LIFSTVLENKIKRVAVLFLGIIVIATFWHVEKTKLISQYGVIFHEMGMRCNDECGWDKQLRYFKKAVRHNPNLSAAHHQLALTYEEMGDYSKSFESFRRVTELDYGNTFAFYKVGVQRFREGAYEHALRYLLTATAYGRKDRPDDATYYLARIYDRKGEYDLAAHHYYRVPRYCPEHTAESYTRFAEIFHLLKKDERTSALILQLRKQHRSGLADQLEKAFEATQAAKISREE